KSFSFFKISDSDIIVETIKKAEDDNSIIIRVYESKGNRKQGVSLTFYKNIKNAWETNLIEEEGKQISFEDNKIVFNINPYEIKTFKVDL
ncbi:MAG: glycosyl hydrolase-related protein, partial [Defluviitoga tunisiensis]